MSEQFLCWLMVFFFSSLQVNFTEKDYHEVFDKEKIVYLSADSPNILEKLSDDQVYIIGGLVDHNQYRVGFQRIKYGDYKEIKKWSLSF